MDILVSIAFVVILLGAEVFTNGTSGSAEAQSPRARGFRRPPWGRRSRTISRSCDRGDSESSEAVGVGRSSAPFMLHARHVRHRRGVLFWREKGQRRDRMAVDTTVLVHDIRYFVAVRIAIGSVRRGWAQYVVRSSSQDLRYYVKGHSTPRGAATSRLAPLRFHRVDRPAGASRRSRGSGSSRPGHAASPSSWAGRTCSSARSTLARLRRQPPALVIAPTRQVPEKFNSLIWVRQGKDTRAMARTKWC
jgi:cation:H+ antiporter